MPGLLAGGDLTLLLSSFSLVGTLFSLNCYVVSSMEMRLDHSQEVIRDTAQSGHDFRVWLSFSIYLLSLGIGSLLQCIPAPLAVASVFGSLCLMTLVLLKQKVLQDSRSGDPTDRTVCSFLADLSLSVSAVLVLVWL